MKCKTCGLEIHKITTMLRALEENKCNKCYMESRADLDRTGRSSKKDKYKNIYERDRNY